MGSETTTYHFKNPVQNCVIKLITDFEFNIQHYKIKTGKQDIKQVLTLFDLYFRSQTPATNRRAVSKLPSYGPPEVSIAQIAKQTWNT